ncbi:MAG TPA: DUF2325 domain-containing protein [Novimethylophilus sp.]|jgi:hypothetical protein|uniref:DUF2325 domain-containing protein n=1 Tax=Novimethylophilus sp. TaxID=2137426 RepID=UPI002F3F6880
MSGELQHPAGSRRPRLWEMEHKCHCPIVGVCFDMGEIRKLLGKVMKVPGRPNDFEIHVTAVRECEAHTPLASLLHKELEKKYALYVQRHKTVKDAEGLYALWQKAMEDGDIAGPLWAILSHASCTEELLHAVYCDVHMLQHQVGAGHRVEQRALLRLRHENAALGRELADIQSRFTKYCEERTLEISALKEQLAAARADVVRHESTATRCAAELDSLRGMIADADDHLRLSYRMLTAEAECTALKAGVAELETQLGKAEADNRRLETELARLAGPEAGGQPILDSQRMHAVQLDGCTVLCVGGLGSATPRYRTLVEKRGGAFLHHDGGAEENIRRLESVVAAADAVICQTGCISHNAYWRVKEQCKRTGKPCTFVANPSLSSFLQVLDELARHRTEPIEEEHEPERR